MSDICQELHGLLAQQTRYRFPYRQDLLASNGIYVLYERGEFGHGGERIVRIGTHDGDGNLVSRLDEHFIKENKDRSVFRKNIGRAMLNKASDPFLKQWEIDRTKKSVRENLKKQVDPRRLQQIERKVTERIQGYFSFVIIPVPLNIDRHMMEARLIASVANCAECHPSPNWLGLYSPNAKICASGLWQVQHLDGEPLNQSELTLLQRLLS